LDLRPTNLQALHLRFEGVHRKSGISRSIPHEGDLSLPGVVQQDLAIKSFIWALSDSFVDMLASLRSFDHMRDLSIAHIEISPEVEL